MAGSPTLIPESRFGSTLRRDPWWIEILPVFLVLGGFGAYATLRAFEGKFYSWGPYLSPFYSPLIDPDKHWWHFSPALLILAGPLGFRATCYYYRKAYYRAFFLDPPACAVGEPARRNYRGETAFPVVLLRWPLWHWGWHARPDDQCHPSLALHFFLPLPPSSCWRQTRLLFLRD